MIRRFVKDTPLGVPVTDVIPSTVPPQAVLDDLERHHVMRHLTGEGNSSQKSLAKKAVSIDNQAHTLFYRYCHGVAASLRGSTSTASDHCRLRLQFQLGPLKYPILVTNEVSLEEEYRLSVAALVERDMCSALEEYALCGYVSLMEVTLESMVPILTENVPMSSKRYYYGNLELELSLSGKWEHAATLATILSSPVFDVSAFFDGGVILSRRNINNFELMNAANDPVDFLS